MTKSEAKKALKDIERTSEEDLGKALDFYRKDSGRRRNVLASSIGILGALAGAHFGRSAGEKVLGSVLGGAVGGGVGALSNRLFDPADKKRIYNEIKRRKDKRISKILNQLDPDDSSDLKYQISQHGLGVQSKDTEYGSFVRGKGSYSGDDRLVLKKDENGRPILSLLFAGINSSVEDGSDASARSPLSERFYNKNRSKFSDVQANSIFDDPIVADAYMDKIVEKILSNRKKNGFYPRVRVVGYSAGGRGIVNFLKKMRERDPNFRADEIIGIDPYQYPWESIPKSLSDPSNPVADKIVYSRLADNYTGSSQNGIGRIGDAISNTAVSLAGKKLRGLSANTIVENKIPGISHTDAEPMYQSALKILSTLNKGKNNE